jgi:hypothetical protein
MAGAAERPSFCLGQDQPKKAVSRKARKERKGKSDGYLPLAFHLIGSAQYLHKS